MSGLNSIGWCTRFGAVLGLLAYGVGIPWYPDISFPGALILSASFGAGVGAISSAIIGPLFMKRDVAAAETPMVFVSAAFVVVLALLTGHQVFVLMVASATAFVLIGAVIALTTPRIWKEPGLCWRCGFDLRGSMESQRCPECGTALSPPIAQPSTPGKRPLFDIPRWIRTRPMLSVLAVTLIVLAFRGYSDFQRRDRMARLQVAILQSQADSSFVDLSKFGPKKFDRVYLFAPYTDERTIQTATGTKFRPPNESKHDNAWLVLYVEGTQVTEFLTVGLFSERIDPMCNAGLMQGRAFLRANRPGIAECGNTPP